VENETEVEREMLAFWSWIMAEREGAVQLSNLIAFEEKSFSVSASIVWLWRKKHPGQAAVMSHGRTRQRKTVILPSSSTVKKFTSSGSSTVRIKKR
jgi:hypothetical protein